MDQNFVPPGKPGAIVRDLRGRIIAGTLRPGERVPSTRQLAAHSGVSRGSVVAAYEQLVGEGWLVATPAGTRVNPQVRTTLLLDAPCPPPAATVAPRPRGTAGGALRPGIPDTGPLASTAWRRAWRQAAAQPSLGAPPAGDPRLIAQVTEHVRWSRSVPDADRAAVITGGARSGLALVLQALAARAGRPLRVAVEDPGYPSLRQVPQRAGHTAVPVPVDADGMSLAALAAREAEGGNLDAVLVTPCHQYPMGGAMTAARRVALLQWAARAGVWVIEDDFDSELRYVGDPVPALASMDSAGVVVTVGSFAKSLTPGLGLGFVIVPHPLRADVLAAAASGTPVSGIVQDAVATFLEDGGLRTHIARMRRAYRRRRHLLHSILTPACAPAPGVRVLPMDGGLNAVVALPDAAAEQRVAAAARRAGLGVAALEDYWYTAAAQRARTEAGVVVGIGAARSEDALARSLRTLAHIVVAAAPTGTGAPDLTGGR
ncbi:MocR-like pyridoxine biosynthesis transcription factor PdxR [Corynebacterium uberis]|uniref:MocR-like pyridoxine biosynthesis transcription factor PdxR n=1 Tax=Corynebacterium TaxID=1716 RepID=UPI001D0B3BF4|nr:MULTISPECIES: PLP-dependent aminotransferase family protein [Corynebacterium]MCZ9310055.1 PLP-dependent aminotransferase family protein [Corynebacterium sp. c6VSa_13]UDL73803.1 PLP-dependent aminotransferase family protein [Corynebacterium uberis]UDL75314.1 PLP-dependent aminotransferase family protein [Corynebacterium uberis]UDL77525.1 PLP-dependent aminotransferase family protein [Corynebacterium uberis]UDL79812.1 PLP-dependent aminotransferase family protein [Corynebacterium uberis]